MASAEELYFEDFNGVALGTTFHHAATRGDDRVVVMAHGLHGTKAGPSRYFVDLARELAIVGVCSLRFDQLGCGDSDGRFENSSFHHRAAAIEHFARKLHAGGFRVALLGQSMGANATLAAASKLGNGICGIALWCADPQLGNATPAVPGEWIEEGGERLRSDYWVEAQSFDFLDAYQRLPVPAYMVFGTADHFVSEATARKMESANKPGDRIRVIEGLPHSAWPYAARTEILRETRDTLVSYLTP